MYPALLQEIRKQSKKLSVMLLAMTIAKGGPDDDGPRFSWLIAEKKIPYILFFNNVQF